MLSNQRLFINSLLALILTSNSNGDPPENLCGVFSSQGEDMCETKGGCDDYELRDGFTIPEVTNAMTIRLRFVTFALDNGQDALVDQQDVNEAIATLNDDFQASGIQFVTSGSLVVENSSRFRSFCSQSTPSDCICRTLPSSNISDMCRISCIDLEDDPPKTTEEWDLKYYHGEDPETQLNVYITNLYQWAGYNGVGRFPWCVDPLSHMGGVLVNSAEFGDKCGQGNSAPCHFLTHELGHNMGLWHTFHGGNELTGDPNPDGCLDCSETAECDGSPSNADCDEVGDYCSDTPAANTFTGCSGSTGYECFTEDPMPMPDPWHDTDKMNFMSYAFDCLDRFTEQQGRRMHCWVCDVAPGWIDSPDCNENEAPDVCDISSGWSVDCNETGVPDECEFDCNENGYHDSCDIDTEYSEDCDENGIPDECQWMQQRACCYDSTCGVMNACACDDLGGAFLGMYTSCSGAPCAMLP